MLYYPMGSNIMQWRQEKASFDGMSECQNGRMAEWQNGRMAEWQNDKMTEWQNGRMVGRQNRGSLDSELGVDESRHGRGHGGDEEREDHGRPKGKGTREEKMSRNGGGRGRRVGG